VSDQIHYIIGWLKCCLLARFGVQPSGNLHIADVRPSDAGVYRCIAVNSVSSSSTFSHQTTTLRVRGMSEYSFSVLLSHIGLVYFLYSQ